MAKRQYEVAVILHPDLEIDLETPLQRLDEVLTQVEAEVKRRDEWGKRKLAYPINKLQFGVYVFYLVELEPSRVEELEQSLQLSEDVIRHLVVSYELPGQTQEHRSQETDDDAHNQSEATQDEAS